MKNVRVLAVIVCVMAAANFVSADTIRGINIDFVTIGNAGNPGDTRTDYPDSADPYGCGAVSSSYRIGKYEVTNAQWNAFTAAAGAPTGNDGGYNNSAYFTGNKQPTNQVTWYEAAQFCNYLTSGDKSKGAYRFSGNNANPGDFLGIKRGPAMSSYGVAYVIPTEDEWYKAAYYKPNGSGYSLYANGTNIAPSASDTCYGQSWPFTGPWDVGSGTQEQNGTFDMMGNVWEWNETDIYGYRGLRGGSCYLQFSGLRSSARSYTSPYGGSNDCGFRIASVGVIPEPASAFLVIAGIGLFRFRNKKR